MYLLSVFPKKGTKYNPLHEELNGVRCTDCYFEKGQRGYFLAELEDDCWHEISTSGVVEFTKENGKLTVETLHTIYVFEII